MFNENTLDMAIIHYKIAKLKMQGDKDSRKKYAAYCIYSYVNYALLLLGKGQGEQSSEILHELLNYLPPDSNYLRKQEGFLHDNDDFGIMLPGIE